MRIGIDARLYGTVGKGLGRYISELIHQLETLDHENEYVIFLRDCNFDEYEPSQPNFRKVRAEYRWYSWAEQLLLPWLLRRHDLNLVHFPHFNVPLLYRRPFVVTIHDLILLQHPSTRASTLGPLIFKLKFLAYRLAIRRAVSDSRAVITVSEFSRQDIQNRFPSSKNKKIHVTYEASSKGVTNADRTDLGRAEEIAGTFALYVGNAYPHKNLASLLRSFRKLREAGHDEYRLVLVGAKDHFYEQLESLAEELNISRHVTFFGRATDAELAELYCRASFYVFPSLYEGFGLPPLEAMSKNLPVASSKSACMPEILGDAAHYFDARDINDMTRAMTELAENEALRKDLIERGERQVKKYDWSICGKQTLEIYREANERSR